MQLGAQGSFGKPGHSGNLLVAIADDVVKHEDPARAGRQRRDGTLEVDRLLDVDRWNAPFIARGGGVVPLGSVVVATGVLGWANARLAPCVAAHAHQVRIHGDAVQPRRERRLAAEGREALPRLHEDILRELSGLRAVAGESQAEREDASHVGVVQRFERSDVAGTRSRNEEALVSRLGR